MALRDVNIGYCGRQAASKIRWMPITIRNIDEIPIVRLPNGCEPWVHPQGNESPHPPRCLRVSKGRVTPPTRPFVFGPGMFRIPSLSLRMKPSITGLDHRAIPRPLGMGR